MMQVTVLVVCLDVAAETSMQSRRSAATAGSVLQDGQ
jgi:hypothetical protein